MVWGINHYFMYIFVLFGSKSNPMFLQLYSEFILNQGFYFQDYHNKWLLPWPTWLKLASEYIL